MLTDPQIWLSLASLTALEIVLGIKVERKEASNGRTRGSGLLSVVRQIHGRRYRLFPRLRRHGEQVSKGDVYFAMGFSLLVELFKMRFRSGGDGKSTVEPEDCR